MSSTTTPIIKVELPLGQSPRRGKEEINIKNCVHTD